MRIALMIDEAVIVVGQKGCVAGKIQEPSEEKKRIESGIIIE